MEVHEQLSYLLACYMIIADKEINSLELEVIERDFPLEETCDLYRQRQLIFSDDKEKPILDDLLREVRLLNITLCQKEAIVRLLAGIAYVDNYIAIEEKLLLDKVANALNINITEIIKDFERQVEERLQSVRLSITKRVIGKAENIAYNLLESGTDSKRADLLLRSLGYSTTIEKIVNTAYIDLERVTRIVNEIICSLNSTQNSLSQIEFSKKKDFKEVEEVEKTIDVARKHFEELINISQKEILEVLDKKRRNIRYFTIAFMGRTKAGKSTLHKVITQQEVDDIGNGKQRTTRFNRSWYWNKLRVIDTPGIGAPGGDNDTEIAKSIIDEADIICYVVTNDSIQETEFNFVDTIKEYNKPLYIVLNVKGDLKEPVRFKKFLKDPNAWKNTVGSQSIQGHLSRIHDQLDGKYNMDAIEIIPIHLLAAQLGLSKERPSEERNILLEASNIYKFTRSITATVHKSGSLKKSLSVIDGTAYKIHKMREVLFEDLKDLKESHNLLSEKSENFNSFMEVEWDKLVKDIESIFSNTKADLYNRASTFAGENYDNSDAAKFWEEDTQVKSIYLRLNELLKERMEDYNNKVKSRIEEMASDIQVLDTFSASSSVVGESIVNTRLGMGVFGAILSAAIPFAIANIWNPAGWIIGASMIGVSVLVTCISSLFTSKQDKIRKATEHMRKQLEESIDLSMEENKKSVLKEVEKLVTNKKAPVLNLFSTYVDGTKKIICKVDELTNQLEQGESVINSIVSFRILEYVRNIIAKRDIDSLDDYSLTCKYPVERDWVKQSLTYKYSVSLNPKEIKKIN